MSTFDCTDIKAILSGLVDDEIDSETRHVAERHLSGCPGCRALVNEAEGLDDLIAMEAATLAPRRLPEGFVDSVLSRTVYARLYEQAGWSWTNWLGWVAAAACLVLSATIWILDRQVLPKGPNSDVVARLPTPPLPNRSTDESPYLRSTTFDGGVLPVGYTQEFPLDDATRKAIDDELALAQPTSAALEQISQKPTIAPADAETLRNTAMVLGMLADSDLTTFKDVERVREIAAYDNLPQRLADVRSRLRPADRAVVMAAESIILRIVNGPMDLNDLRLLHDTVASMNLAKQVGTIGAGGNDAATSL